MEEKLSAKTLIAQKMKGIKSEVTNDDRKEAETVLRISQPTITKYLQGDIPKPDLAISLYEFFLGRIKERIERIRSVA